MPAKKRRLYRGKKECILTPTPRSPPHPLILKKIPPHMSKAPILRERPDTATSAPYCDKVADTAAKPPILREAPILRNLTCEISLSLRRPGRRTLTLIDKALSYLTPFESPRATVASSAERRDLLELLDTHRMTLCPYLDIDKVEWNLRRQRL